MTEQLVASVNAEADGLDIDQLAARRDAMTTAMQIAASKLR